MKTKLNTFTTRWTLLTALICTTPILAFAGGNRGSSAHVENSAPEVVREHTARLETRSVLPAERTTVTKEYIRHRLDWLKVRHPEHSRMLGYFDTLIGDGYDPLLLDAWLDGLYDGTVVVGMPGDLLVKFYGEPQFRKEVVFKGAPASEWGIQLLPGRVEKVTVAGGKVVRVRG